jgi:predicted Zn-ribbon and HTH transcriptional regulator
MIDLTQRPTMKPKQCADRGFHRIDTRIIHPSKCLDCGAPVEGGVVEVPIRKKGK